MQGQVAGLTSSLLTSLTNLEKMVEVGGVSYISSHV
jgi:hypothetical protein